MCLIVLLNTVVVVLRPVIVANISDVDSTELKLGDNMKINLNIPKHATHQDITYLVSSAVSDLHMCIYVWYPTGSQPFLVQGPL